MELDWYTKTVCSILRMYTDSLIYCTIITSQDFVLT